jgi:hypothetical protein
LETPYLRVKEELSRSSSHCLTALRRLVTAVDYLIYSMASAELKTLSEESQVLNSYKAIVSSNVRTLLA